MKGPRHPAPSIHQTPCCSPLPLARRSRRRGGTSAPPPFHQPNPAEAKPMEAEAFPIRFTQGVRAYWRRRKYHRLADAAGGNSKPRSRSRQLGLSSSGGARVGRRVRVLLAGPRRALARARDAYVGGMLALAKRASALALPGAVEALWAKRVPRRKQRRQGQLPAAGGKATEFEQRLIFEIYKSIVASKELTTMLHSSAAHLPPTKTAPAAGVPSTHLLDM